MGDDHLDCCYAEPTWPDATFYVPGGRVRVFVSSDKFGKSLHVVYQLRPQDDGHPIKQPAEIWRPPRAA